MTEGKTGDVKAARTWTFPAGSVVVADRAYLDETAILLTWYHEAETLEQVKARLEGAYSWRELVQALHRVGLTRGEGARQINRFAVT